MPSIVKVHVHAARGLPVMDTASQLADAYCEITLGKLPVRKTPVAVKTLNPAWNASYKLEVSDDAELLISPLVLRVMDRDILRDDAVGTVLISLEPLVSSATSVPTIESWLHGAGAARAGIGAGGDASAKADAAPHHGSAGNHHKSLSGWFPIWDTQAGCRGLLHVAVEVRSLSHGGGGHGHASHHAAGTGAGGQRDTSGGSGGGARDQFDEGGGAMPKAASSSSSSSNILFFSLDRLENRVYPYQCYCGFVEELLVITDPEMPSSSSAYASGNVGAGGVGSSTYGSGGGGYGSRGGNQSVAVSAKKNEARQLALHRLAYSLRSCLARKAASIGASAVVGLQLAFDLEPEAGCIVGRACGTAIALYRPRLADDPALHALKASLMAHHQHHNENGTAAEDGHRHHNDRQPSIPSSSSLQQQRQDVTSPMAPMRQASGHSVTTTTTTTVGSTSPIIPARLTALGPGNSFIMPSKDSTSTGGFQSMLNSVRDDSSAPLPSAASRKASTDISVTDQSGVPTPLLLPSRGPSGVASPLMMTQDGSRKGSVAASEDHYTPVDSYTNLAALIDGVVDDGQAVQASYPSRVSPALYPSSLLTLHTSQRLHGGSHTHHHHHHHGHSHSHHKGGKASCGATTGRSGSSKKDRSKSARHIGRRSKGDIEDATIPRHPLPLHLRPPIPVGAPRHRYSRVADVRRSDGINILTVAVPPPGSRLHIGGMVTARSVKYLAGMMAGAFDQETRDGWWAELRKEVRDHAARLLCTQIMGYREEICIRGTAAVLSVSGTAVRLKNIRTQGQVRALLAEGQERLKSLTKPERRSLKRAWLSHPMQRPWYFDPIRQVFDDATAAASADASSMGNHRAHQKQQQQQQQDGDDDAQYPAQGIIGGSSNRAAAGGGGATPGPASASASPSVKVSRSSTSVNIAGTGSSPARLGKASGDSSRAASIDGAAILSSPAGGVAALVVDDEMALQVSPISHAHQSSAQHQHLQQQQQLNPDSPIPPPLRLDLEASSGSNDEYVVFPLTQLVDGGAASGNKASNGEGQTANGGNGTGSHSTRDSMITIADLSLPTPGASDGAAIDTAVAIGLPPRVPASTSMAAAGARLPAAPPPQPPVLARASSQLSQRASIPHVGSTPLFGAPAAGAQQVVTSSSSLSLSARGRNGSQSEIIHSSSSNSSRLLQQLQQHPNQPHAHRRDRLHAPKHHPAFAAAMLGEGHAARVVHPGFITCDPVCAPTAPTQLPCSLVHLPATYATTGAGAPFSNMQVAQCRGCKRAYVPAVLMASMEPPSGLPTSGPGLFIVSRAVRRKHTHSGGGGGHQHGHGGRRGGGGGAGDGGSSGTGDGKALAPGEQECVRLSEELLFLEYAMHQQMMLKLKAAGRNAVFAVRSSIEFHGPLIIGTMTGTAVLVTAMPPPGPFQLRRNTSAPVREQFAALLAVSNHERRLLGLHVTHAPIIAAALRPLALLVYHDARVRYIKARRQARAAAKVRASRARNTLTMLACDGFSPLPVVVPGSLSATPLIDDESGTTGMVPVGGRGPLEVSELLSTSVDAITLGASPAAADDDDVATRITHPTAISTLTGTPHASSRHPAHGHHHHHHGHHHHQGHHHHHATPGTAGGRTSAVGVSRRSRKGSKAERGERRHKDTSRRRESKRRGKGDRDRSEASSSRSSVATDQHPPRFGSPSPSSTPLHAAAASALERRSGRGRGRKHRRKERGGSGRHRRNTTSSSRSRRGSDDSDGSGSSRSRSSTSSGSSTSSRSTRSSSTSGTSSSSSSSSSSTDTGSSSSSSSTSSTSTSSSSGTRTSSTSTTNTDSTYDTSSGSSTSTSSSSGSSTSSSSSSSSSSSDDRSSTSSSSSSDSSGGRRSRRSKRSVSSRRSRRRSRGMQGDDSDDDLGGDAAATANNSKLPSSSPSLPVYVIEIDDEQEEDVAAVINEVRPPHGLSIVSTDAPPSSYASPDGQGPLLYPTMAPTGLQPAMSSHAGPAADLILARGESDGAGSDTSGANGGGRPGALAAVYASAHQPAPLHPPQQQQQGTSEPQLRHTWHPYALRKATKAVIAAENGVDALAAAVGPARKMIKKKRRGKDANNNNIENEKDREEAVERDISSLTAVVEPPEHIQLLQLCFRVKWSSLALPVAAILGQPVSANRTGRRRISDAGGGQRLVDDDNYAYFEGLSSRVRSGSLQAGSSTNHLTGSQIGGGTTPGMGSMMLSSSGASNSLYDVTPSEGGGGGSTSAQHTISGHGGSWIAQTMASLGSFIMPAQQSSDFGDDDDQGGGNSTHNSTSNAAGGGATGGPGLHVHDSFGSFRTASSFIGGPEGHSSTGGVGTSNSNSSFQPGNTASVSDAERLTRLHNAVMSLVYARLRHYVPCTLTGLRMETSIPARDEIMVMVTGTVIREATAVIVRAPTVSAPTVNQGFDEHSVMSTLTSTAVIASPASLVEAVSSLRREDDATLEPLPSSPPVIISSAVANASRRYISRLMRITYDRTFGSAAAAAAGSPTATPAPLQQQQSSGPLPIGPPTAKASQIDMAQLHLHLQHVMTSSASPAATPLPPRPISGASLASGGSSGTWWSAMPASTASSSNAINKQLSNASAARPRLPSQSLGQAGIATAPSGGGGVGHQGSHGHGHVDFAASIRAQAAVVLTPCCYLPGRTTTAYLGCIHLSFIREGGTSTSTSSSSGGAGTGRGAKGSDGRGGGSSGGGGASSGSGQAPAGYGLGLSEADAGPSYMATFLQTVHSEVNAMARAHAAALGGTAVLNYAVSVAEPEGGSGGGLYLLAVTGDVVVME